MNNTVEIFVGIDVSKATLDVALWQPEQAWQVRNDIEGIGKLLERLQELRPNLVVIEATGGYEKLIVAELVLAKVPVSVVLMGVLSVTGRRLSCPRGSRASRAGA